jgi:hypothetical protein
MYSCIAVKRHADGKRAENLDDAPGASLFVCPRGAGRSSGGQGRNRTTDTRIFSPLLYRLSYLATFLQMLRTSRALCSFVATRFVSALAVDPYKPISAKQAIRRHLITGLRRLPRNQGILVAALRPCFNATSESAAFYPKTAAGKPSLENRSPLARASYIKRADCLIVVNISVFGFLEEQGSDNQCDQCDNDRVPQTIVNISGCCNHGRCCQREHAAKPTVTNVIRQ